MIKTLKVRLYPDEEQKILLEKHFGSCRWVWNHFLEIRTKYYAEHKKGLTAFDTMKLLTNVKKEITWLNEINSQCLQHSLVELDKAFKSFFRKNSEYPNFRTKRDNQYFIVPSGFKANENKLILPKFQEGIEYRDKSSIPEKIKQII
ncbi:MAG: helix-turn-helix domain-containing protein, partial [Candidatus Thermoplasmatota archaeon]|nr:helix-turn-helix domain-containing protein [Candidatus Thermoplasmatota archaeon]